jgi:hypothetical protein
LELPPRRCFRRAAGHSLIEFIGVAAVLAVLAATLIPVFIRRTDKTALAKEITEMNTISNALVLQVVRNQHIPDTNDWASTAAQWAFRSGSQILTNSRGFARLYLYDQGGWLGANAGYSQTYTGAVVRPTSVRVAVVSTIANSLPYLNGPISTADFNSVWNDAPHSTPSYLSGQGWTGRPDDLVVARISLDPLFHHLILTTRDTSGMAHYSVQPDNTLGAVPNNGTGWDSYYLHNTPVSLWSGTTTLTNTFLLAGDKGYTWDGGMWQMGPSGASSDNSSLATNYVAQAAQFLGTPIPPNAANGPSAQGVVAAFCTFMYSYTIWANECPHFYTSASSLGQATDYQLLNALAANNGIIDAAAGQNGLLK